MNKLIQPRLRRRVLITSVAIIALVTSALAGVINKLYSQSYMASYSSELVAQMPMVVAQLNRAGLIKDVDKWIDSLDPSDTDYIAVVCDQADNTTWLSHEANKANLKNVCRYLPENIPTPTLIKMGDNKGYIAYNLSRDKENGNIYQLVVLRSANDYEKSLEKLHQRTAFYLGLFVLIAVAFLIAAFHWGFQPLRKLASQLDQMAEAKREKLDNDYPMELQEVTKAVNRLNRISSDQKGRYRHAMDDLAHSLKTRLAATNALLDDKTLERHELNQRIMEQISQMDDLVQYQLKRAMVGQQGLQKSNSQLMPVVNSLSLMLGKIYADKQAKLHYHFNEDIMLPLNKDDLMELFGNMLENSFRFCISQVHITVIETNTHFTIKIEDDGPGVKLDMREAIFQRGVRSDQLNPGQGIGLSVCNEIIDSYQGTIYVEDSPLEGAAFIITLPKLND
ncbi:MULTISPECIES: ATP-binding protein [unclassified Photobacterium]|uniref:ATP-binding protein n=1 Tax=unclassified Photobacterium TaxID=2628852 RepID=UPI000D16170D|nr:MULTISPECIES: ATP-binding protein [unclassified Photobacterium]PSV29030.1 ATPase [Photobacterium sp. GB-56]PSV33115.1 ATPase [Photobacterium sp. GB-72]PSV40924.1 ATPase [Photobacterium sp. GB-210]PSV47973.1 ATPase [Photobacterium sp. GB-36]PSV55072.1 ATPase [Photobacterium sp. GB-1]